MYSILITPSAQRQLANLPDRFRGQIERKIESLAAEPLPANCKALQGKQFQGLYRIRSRDYRIVYQVQHTKLIVLIVRIGDRKDICRL